MNNSPKRIHDQIFWYSSIAIAFFLPVSGKVVPPVIGIMFLNWMIDGRFIRNFTHLFSEIQRGWTFSFASFYLLYVAGLLYTTNFDYGWFDLEVKLSLFVFPLIFATYGWPLFSERQTRYILWAFVAGCVVGTIMLLGHAGMNKFSLGIPNSFYYMKLAWFFHTSYLSMYYNFAVAFLILMLITGKNMKSWRPGATLAVALFLVHMIFLLSSKAGIIILGINTVLLSGFALIRLNRLRLAGVILATGIFVFGVEYFVTPEAFSRMSKAEEVISTRTGIRIHAESNADRMAVWFTAREIIKNNLIFGVGTGDVKDALMEGYRKHNFIPALEHKFNAHSQYLQTFITLGLVGFLLLLATLVFPAVRALCMKQDLYLIFLMIFAMNILFESMLEIQQGVIFYAFFNMILFTSGRSGIPEPAVSRKVSSI